MTCILVCQGGSLRDPVGRQARYCSAYIRRCIVVYMKTMIDVDDEALELAARELGTTTKKDTVNAALEFVAGRRRRIEQLLDEPYALGVGPDITDPDVMRTARR
jgi:Arc/MetJ family transcription regulator